MVFETNYKLEELAQKYKSIAAKEPYKAVSKKYTFVPTMKILRTFDKEGWKPVEVQETKPRIKAKAGYQKHLIRLRHISMFRKNFQQEIPEIVIVNSHDKSSAFQIKLGIFRLVCSNGLIIGKYLKNYRIIHINYNEQIVEQAINEITTVIPNIIELINEMKQKQLTEKEQFELAYQAMQLRWNPNIYHVPVENLLQIRRTEDEKNDLWITYNRIQENIIKGGIKVINKTTKKERLARAITSIDTQVKVNEKLFNLAEQFID